MRIGSARVSTEAQALAWQRDALRHAGCERILTEKASAGHRPRLGLSEARSHLRPGAVLVVWKLERLGRSVTGCVDLVGALAAEGVPFQRLTEGIDPPPPQGRFFFHLMASLAQMERARIGERTPSGAGGGPQAGAGGRPEAPYDAEQDRVSAATPAWRDATPGGGARARGLHPYPLSLGTGVKPRRSREVRVMGRERRKWEHTLPRFPFYCHTNP